MEMDKEKEKEKEKDAIPKVKETVVTGLQQQSLKSWQPIITPSHTVCCHWIFVCIFAILGAVMILANMSVVEVVQGYDDCAMGATCTKVITIPADMKPPVYVYYQLKNFYQNHRRYVKSRLDSQLLGKSYTKAELETCAPYHKSNGSSSLSLFPCGLVANSFFNDTFSANYQGKELTEDNFNWVKKGISLSWDKDKFSNRGLRSDETNINRQGRTVLPTGVTLVDEDFMNWMRPAGMSTFRKLYRVIQNVTLTGGSTISISIQNRFPVKSFNGEKAVVLSTVSWLGGKNDILPWMFVAIGGLHFLLALYSTLKPCAPNRPIGDAAYFEKQALAQISARKS